MHGLMENLSDLGKRTFGWDQYLLDQVSHTGYVGSAVQASLR
jgi:hypothetical protein